MNFLDDRAASPLTKKVSKPSPEKRLGVSKSFAIEKKASLKKSAAPKTPEKSKIVVELMPDTSIKRRSPSPRKSSRSPVKNKASPAEKPEWVRRSCRKI